MTRDYVYWDACAFLAYLGDEDGADLLARLEALDYAGCCAVLDAVERWWTQR